MDLGRSPAAPAATDPWTTFGAAGRTFADLVARIGEDSWGTPGLGAWDLRALVGHASRSLTTVSTYLQQPVEVEDLPSPVAYYLAVLPSPGVPGAGIDPSSVAERGRTAGEALGDAPALAVQALLGDALARLADREDRLIATIAGGMRVSAYLPTRTFELVVHGLDVGAATGLDVRFDEDVLAEAAGLAARVAVARGLGGVVLSSLTGRTALPAGFSVV